MSNRGRLFIVSAPSGTGKTTLVERLVQIVPDVRMSRSYTSRAARAGERDGVDYNFISRNRFDAMIGEGAFLEHADVFGNYYGTGVAHTEAELARGTRLHSITRHMLGLFHGMPGARAYRRHLATEAVKPGAGANVLREAMDMVRDRAVSEAAA